MQFATATDYLWGTRGVKATARHIWLRSPPGITKSCMALRKREAQFSVSQCGHASMQHRHLSSVSSLPRASSFACRSDDSASRHRHLNPYDKSRSLSTIQIKDIYDSDQIETSHMPRFCTVVNANSTRFRDSHSAQVALGLMMIDSTRAGAEIVRLGPLRP